MKIYICDDHEDMRERIETLLIPFSSSEKTFEVTTFSDGESLVKHYREGRRTDVLFLDIEMEGIDGLEVAKELRAMDSELVLIFVSAHSSMVFDCLDYGIFHFVVKPFTDEAFQTVFERALKQYRENHSQYAITWYNDTILVPVKDILYLESNGRKLTIYTTTGKYKTLRTLAEAQEELEVSGFVRCHQSYLVNMNMIRRFDENDVVLLDGTHIMMSVRRRTLTLKTYKEFVKRFS